MFAETASWPTTGTAMSLLEIRSLCKQYEGLKALSDVSFDVEEGSIVGLIGPNGAGKTTLFDCLTGCIPKTSGAVV